MSAWGSLICVKVDSGIRVNKYYKYLTKPFRDEEVRKVAERREAMAEAQRGAQR